MSAASGATLEFPLPAERAAHDPPEARGLRRDGVRLMVSRSTDDRIIHTRFHRLADVLEPGDLLVVNTTATINAALEARRESASGEPEDVLLHLSTPLSADRWVIELRRVTEAGNVPLFNASAGETIRLQSTASARLIAPYRDSTRLWIAQMSVPLPVLDYAARYGSPIRYGYVRSKWPLSSYQTMFAEEPGSAEMPSAARAFTPAVVEGLEQKGVQIATVLLHAGVSSLEANEPPYPERYRVSRETADAIHRTRAAGARVIAVGTTVVRALETVAAPSGVIRPGGGWTDLVITPERGLFAVDGLLTGLHAPDASHLMMLETVAGHAHLVSAYEAALNHGYLWHEFGDLHLLLP